MSIYISKLKSNLKVWLKVHEADESGTSGTYFPSSTLGKTRLEPQFKITAHRRIPTAGRKNPAAEARMMILCVHRGHTRPAQTSHQDTGKCADIDSFPSTEKSWFATTAVFFPVNWKYRFDGWTRNWLDGHIQRVTVNGSMYKWKTVMSSVPQASVLGLIPFSISINDREWDQVHSHQACRHHQSEWCS